MIELNKDNWTNEVENVKGWVIVDFWSPKCEPCKELKPAFLELEEKYGATIKFCGLDITKARRVAIGQKVLGLPVIAFYSDGKKVIEFTGEIAIDDVEAKIKDLIG